MNTKLLFTFAMSDMARKELWSNVCSKQIMDRIRQHYCHNNGKEVCRCDPIKDWQEDQCSRIGFGLTHHWNQR